MQVFAWSLTGGKANKFSLIHWRWTSSMEQLEHFINEWSQTRPSQDVILWDRAARPKTEGQVLVTARDIPPVHHSGLINMKICYGAVKRAKGSTASWPYPKDGLNRLTRNLSAGREPDLPEADVPSLSPITEHIRRREEAS
jgi:hypothetical protein